MSGLSIMLSKLNSPMYIALVAFVAFVAGVFVFGKHHRRWEMFDQWSIPMTVVEEANMPKKLPLVKQYPYVTDHDYYYRKFGG